jgi:signal transduction histidine kinase
MTEPTPRSAGVATLAVALLLLLTLLATLFLDFRGNVAQAVTWHRQVGLAVVPLGEQHLHLGRHLPESALLDLDDSDLRPPDDAAWQGVALPDAWPRAAALDEQRPHALWMRWYRIGPVAPADAQAIESLYVSRAIGGPLVIWARPFGAERAAWIKLHDNRAEWLTQWNRPLLVNLPGPAPQRWEVALGLPAIDGAPMGLGSVASGPHEALQAKWDERRFWQVEGPRVMSLSGLLLGALALALAWRGQQRGAHLLLAAISGVWSLRNLHFFVAPPAQPLAFEWFWWLTNISVNWLTLLLHLFVLRFLPERLPRLERGLLVYCLLVTLLTVPFWPLHAESLLLQHAATVAMALGVGGFIMARAWRSGNAAPRLLALALGGGTAMAVHDLLLLGGRLSPDHVYVLPYAYLLLILAFQHVLANQHSQAFGALRRAHTEQQRRLAAQQAELEASHRAALASELESTRLRERQQIMRDMHDGIGSSLLGAQALLQRGALQQAELMQLISACIDDLRLVIDSLEPIEDDLATLLGTLRLRLGPRLQAAGVSLDWAVAPDLPALPWLDPPSALQVLRIVQELISNALRHAGATQLRLSLTHAADGLRVDLSDNGQGFDAARLPATGRGLKNMRTRAASIGAELTLSSAARQGTRATLKLPLQRA